MDKSADINKLKMYDLEEGFKELSSESTKKNAALFEFVKSLLAKLQEDRVDSMADIYKRTTELVNKKFSELVTATLEDDTFLDRIGEYVDEASVGGVRKPITETALAAVKKAFKDISEKFSLKKPSGNKANKALESALKKYNDIMEAIEGQQKAKDKEEEKQDKAEDKAADSRGDKAKKAEGGRTPKHPSLNTMVESYRFMTSIDKTLKKHFMSFNAKKLKEQFLTVGRSVLRGAMTGIRKAGNFMGRQIATYFLGPLALLVTPLARLGSFILRTGRTIFGTVKRSVSAVFSPFTRLVNKLFSQSKSRKLLATALVMALLSPKGMYFLGFLFGTVKKWITGLFEGSQKANGEEPDHVREARELSQEEIDKIAVTHKNYLLTGTKFKIVSFFVGDENAKKLDHFFQVIGTLFFGHDTVEERINSNFNTAIDEARGVADPKPNPILLVAQKVGNAIEGIVGKITGLFDKIRNSEVVKRIMEKGVLHEMKVMAVFLGIFAAKLKKTLAGIIVGGTLDIAGKGLRGTLALGAKLLGKGAPFAAAGSNPYVLIGALIAAVGSGLINAVMKIAKDSYNSEKRNADMAKNNDMLIQMLSAGGTVNADALASRPDKVGVDDMSMDGISKMWQEAETQVTQKEIQAQNENAETGATPAPAVGKAMQELNKQMQKLNGNIGLAAKEEASMPAHVPESADDAANWATGEFIRETGLSSPSVSSEADAKDIENVVKAITEKATAELTRPSSENVENLPAVGKDVGKMVEELGKKTSLSVPEYIDVQMFRRWHGFFVLSIVNMYKNHEISFDRFIDLYNKSQDPESNVYKLFSAKTSFGLKNGFGRSLVKEEDLERLSRKFGIYGKDRHKRVLGIIHDGFAPLYMLFQKYSWKNDDVKRTEERLRGDMGSLADWEKDKFGTDLVKQSESEYAGGSKDVETALVTGLEESVMRGGSAHLGEAIRKRREMLEEGMGRMRETLNKEFGDSVREFDIVSLQTSLESSLQATMNNMDINGQENIDKLVDSYIKYARLYLSKKQTPAARTTTVNGATTTLPDGAVGNHMDELADSSQATRDALRKDAEQVQEELDKASKERDKNEAELDGLLKQNSEIDTEISRNQQRYMELVAKKNAGQATGPRRHGPTVGQNTEFNPATMEAEKYAERLRNRQFGSYYNFGTPTIWP